MNKLKAKVVNEKYSDGLGRIEALCGDYLFRLLVFGQNSPLRSKDEAYLLIKESEVAISKSKHTDISISNRIECRIGSLQKGTILCEIGLEFNGEKLTSIITTESTERLGLNVGDTVFALIKANEIYIEEI
ncbi:MAG: molybdopterin-binding protein [Campylobacterales bacterium]